MMLTVIGCQNEATVHRPVNPIFAERAEHEARRNPQEQHAAGQHHAACIMVAMIHSIKGRLISPYIGLRCAHSK
jgi:hypothetical protein